MILRTMCVCVEPGSHLPSLAILCSFSSVTVASARAEVGFPVKIRDFRRLNKCGRDGGGKKPGILRGVVA